MLELTDIHKRYGTVEVLRGVSLTVAPGELVALLGASGAGKTTLLQIAGTLDRPDAGSIAFDGRQLGPLSGAELARFRNQHIGFVFQFHHLLAEFTAEENAAMPALIAGESKAKALAKARDLLKYLQLGHRLDHRPGQLSGGEQQRVAVARALLNEPRLILADEPTGNLDTRNGDALFGLFQQLAQERGVALLVATHNETFGRMANRSIHLRDGQVVTPATPVFDDPAASV